GGSTPGLRGWLARAPPLPAPAPVVARQARDQRGPLQPPAAAAADDVDAEQRVAERHLDAGLAAGEHERLAVDVVGAGIGALAEAHFPLVHGRHAIPGQAEAVAVGAADAERTRHGGLRPKRSRTAAP